MLKTEISYWDGAYAALEGDVASQGIPMWTREPLGDGSFTLKSALQGVAPHTSAVSTFENIAYSLPVQVDNNGAIKESRVGTLIDYWAGGAAGHHGVSVEGKVGYRFRIYLRPVVGRSWWSTTAIPTWYIALGGNGFFRVDKVIGGVVDTLFADNFTEADFLNGDGLRLIGPISTMGPGDYLDLYYVQDEQNNWGGYVFKAVLNPDLNTVATTQDAIRQAPVIGCDLFDTGTQPTKQTLQYYGDVDIIRQPGAACEARITVPLANFQEFDSVGWIYKRTVDDDPGSLDLYTGFIAPNTVKTVRRQRVIRIKHGFTDAYNQDELYNVFTGFVDDFGDAETGTMTIECRGFEQRLLDQFMKNYPDRISYMSANYKKRVGTLQPVYDTPAFDNWPLEIALRELLVRAGIPESVTRQRLQVTLFDGTTRNVTYGQQEFLKFRARSMAGRQIRLERAVHYGNNGDGFNPKKAPDDDYIFKPENTKELWNSIREITDRYGYQIWFDEFGHCMVMAPNNPSFVLDVPTGPAGVKKINPNAYAGTYQEFTTATPTVVLTAAAARIDVVMPRFVAAGSWSFAVVDSHGTTVSSGIANPALPSGFADEFFYDFRTTTNGTNSTVVTLFTGAYDDYIVTLTGVGGAVTRRLDCFFVWHTDPLLPRFDHLFSTDVNATDAVAQGTMQDMRNFVIVVGRRTAVITDSNKLETNPNNPSYEFIVQAAVDVDSILDPVATNFIGYQKESVIYDNRITDKDFAGYLARAFIFKYRIPQPSARITHTTIPILQLWEPIFAVEQKFGTLTADQTLWVTSFQHQIRADRSTTTIGTTAYAPTPSYEPREDIDVDANFGGHPVIDISISYRSLANTVNTNVELGAAVECSGEETKQANIPLVGNVLDLTGNVWPPIPGTVFISPSTGTGPTSGFPQATSYIPPSPSGNPGAPGDVVPPPGRVSLNGTILSPRLYGLVGIQDVQLRVTMPSAGPVITPIVTILTLSTVKPTSPVAFDEIGAWYYQYHADTQQILAVRDNGQTLGFTNRPTFELIIHWFKDIGGVDPSRSLTNNPYHHLFNVDYRDSNRKIYFQWKQGDNSAPYARNPNVTGYTVNYRVLWPGLHTTDPYTGGSPFYDPYSSELGELVTIKWDQLVSGLVRASVRSVYTDEIVAWLTEPSADPNDEETHWTYFTAGAARSVQWDGVDNVGTWNKRQSHLWALFAQGAFEQPQLPVIGQGFYVWNQEQTGNGELGKLAFISALRDPNTGVPVFGQGTYASWYVKWEVLADSLGETARIEKSNKLDPVYNNGSTAAVIYTHLSEPTRVRIKDVSDWTTGGAAYDPLTSPRLEDNWQTGLVTPDAIINNVKPLRIRYTMEPRPGPVWTTRANKASVKLLELVHLRATIFDQFLVFAGAAYAGTDVPQSTLVNRRVTNDEHSVLFKSEQWVLGSQLKQVASDTGREWIFLPKDFKKDFGNGVDEPLRFMDYLQLEEVPFWDESRQIGGKHSRYHIGFMNMLFYFSTYTQDRSGRYCWAINRKWIDRSKIINNQYADWFDPTAPTTPATASSFLTEWPTDLTYQHRRTVITRQWQDEFQWNQDQIARYNIGSGIGKELLRHKWSDHDPVSTTINGIAWSSFTLNQDQYSAWHSSNGRTELPAQFQTLNRQLGNSTTTKLGDWLWETSPIWVPCISRDFHPYFLVPPMPDPPALFVDNLTVESLLNKKYIYLIVDVRDYDPVPNIGNDVAAAEVWNSAAFDMTELYGGGEADVRVRFWPGTVVNNAAGPAKEWMSPSGTRGQKSNMFDYMRQDQMVHWEDLRGLFSRGPRPAEASRKVSPAGAYYINPYGYRGMTVEENSREKNNHIIAGSPSYPRYRIAPWVYTEISGFFDMKFRHQYFWESGTMFPTDKRGVENFAGLNFAKSRYFGPEVLSTLKFDDGAWIGWKDDISTADTADVNYRLYQSTLDGAVSNVFETGFMPVAVGPRLRTPTGELVTLDMLFSLVLLNERREGSL